MNDRDLPEYMYYDEMPQEVKDGLTEVENYPEEWIILYKNSETNQLWAIDVYDKYQWQIAAKVQEKSRWKSLDYTNIRKTLLLKSRGGTEGSKCIWQSCAKNRVRGTVYCVDHLYETGARR